MGLQDIFKDEAMHDKLAQFSKDEISWLEQRVTQKTDSKGKTQFCVPCVIRKKEIKLTPEEVVRQLYANRLAVQYGYSFERMEAEYPVKMGRDNTKRADIVIFADDAKIKPYIVVELKEPNVSITKDEQAQLSSYCQTLGASIGILCNGRDTQNFFYNREDKKNKNLSLEKITYLPKVNQTLDDVLNVRYTIKNLIQKDELQKTTLKSIILDFEDVVLANSGVDSFEEIFKFIFTKLYDELMSSKDSEAVANQIKYGNKTIDQVDDEKFRLMEFRASGTDEQIKTRLDDLFLRAQGKWKGIFPEKTTFNLRPSEMKICVSFLQDVKLLNSNLEVVDDAFEYLVNKEQKGDKGQYFTPRYVIDMCVKMLSPKEDEAMIDTAAGSCGFPMHTIFHVWSKINPNAPSLFTNTQRSERELDYVKNKVFAIEFDKRSVRVGRTLNLIAGDGNTNVLLLNTLEYNQWKTDINEYEWRKVYNEGFFRLDEYKAASDYSAFNFDVLMANPPFAGDIKNSDIVSLYKNLGFDDKGRVIKNISRDILFIERNLNFLKPGGRMAIVLPQGRFNNSSDKRIRDFIADKARILAVVGLHGNTFKPHTGTKTSVLFLQKWTDENGVCPKKDDYNIFFATQQRPGKDNSGEKIYVKEEFVSLYENDCFKEYKMEDFLKKYGSLEEAEIWHEKGEDNAHVIDGKSYRNCIPDNQKSNYENYRMPRVSTRYKRDSHGHIFVDHDLFNHEGLTQDGIAEAFEEFAKSEGLSFFLIDPCERDASKVRLEKLLQGVEGSVVRLGEITNDWFRFDAEYFSKKYIELDKNIKGGNYIFLQEASSISKLAGFEFTKYFTPQNMLSSNFYIALTSKNIQRNDLLLDEYITINKTIANSYLKRSKLYKNDVVLSYTGEYRRALVIQDNDFYLGPNICRIRCNEKMNPYYLSILLNSKIGQTLLDRDKTLSAQPTVAMSRIRQLTIPIINKDFEQKIEKLYRKSVDMKNASRALYAEAQDLLLCELGLKGYRAASPSVSFATKDGGTKTYCVNGSVRAFSFVQGVGRMDAEYFQEKYEEVEGRIKKQTTFRLGDIVDIQKSIEPGSDAYKTSGVPFIRVQDLTEKEIATPSVFLDEKYYSETLALKKDMILFTKDGSIGVAYKVDENIKAITSGAILHLTINDGRFLPDFLYLYLNSVAVKMQAERDAGGSIIQHWKPSEIKQVLVPLLPASIQEKIADLLQRSASLRKESKDLLERAKREVEQEIEKTKTV